MDAITLGSFKETVDENLGRQIHKKHLFNTKRLKGRQLKDTSFIDRNSTTSACLNTLINIIRVSEDPEDDKGIASLALGAILKLDPSEDEKSPTLKWLLNWLYWSEEEERGNKWGDEILKYVSRLNTISYLENRADDSLVATRRWRSMLALVRFSFVVSPLLIDNFVLWMEEDGVETWEELNSLDIIGVSKENVGEHVHRTQFLQEIYLHVKKIIREKNLAEAKRRKVESIQPSVAEIGTRIDKRTNPNTGDRYPSAFEIAEAWCPAKYTKNILPTDPIMVNKLSLFRNKEQSSEELAKRKFNINKIVKNLTTAGTGLQLEMEANRQRAIILSFKASIDKGASKLRSYGRFCDGRGTPHYPVDPVTIQEFAALHSTEATLEGYLGAIANGEMFANIPNELCRQQWESKQIKQIGRGLKKYHVKKKRSAFSPEQTLRICELAPTVFARKFVSRTISDLYAAKFIVIVKLAYIFFLRLEDEAHGLELGDENDTTESLLRGRSHVIFNSYEKGREMTVMKLQQRKNRKAYKPDGYTIVRFCSCGDDHGADKHQISKDFCPVHNIMPQITQRNHQDCMGLSAKSGERLFQGLSPAQVLDYLREIVALDSTVSQGFLGKPEEAGLHSFRRGAATEAFRRGESDPKTRALGDWASKKSKDDYIPEYARESREASIYIQDWEDSDFDVA